MNLNGIKQLAFELLGSKSSHTWKEKGNKYHHGERVANLIMVLRKLILPDDDSHDEILTVAAWLHDIMNGNENHAKEGAMKAREVLADYCSEFELDEICKIINVHDDRASDRSRFSDYIKLHQDADLLDHFGTYDVWMDFIYAIHQGMTFYEVIDRFQNTRKHYNSRYREELNYEISKKIYDEKSRFVNYFGDRLSVEGMGGIWDEKELVKNL